MKKKILLKGPVLTRSGYGEQTRFALRALRSREDIFDIFIQPIKWGATSWMATEDSERVWIDRTIEKTIGFIQSGGQFDMSLQVTIPNEFERIAPINVGFTAGIETTKVAHQWILKGNEMDKILVVSSHSKNTFANTEYQAQDQNTGQRVMLQLTKPIEFVNYPVKTFENLPELELNLDTEFNFLTVAQFGPRKNIHNTIKWFIEEFRNEEVGLVLKTSMAKNCLMDRNKVLKTLSGFIKTLGEKKCKIYLLHGDMTDEEMHSLYNNDQISALLALPHGEGFGLPIYESAYSGLPVISTGWSGQLDFLIDEDGNQQFYNVAFDLAPVQKDVVWDGVLIADSSWAYPRELDAKKQMRLCYEDCTSGNVRWDTSKIADRFSEEKQNKKFADEIISLIGEDFVDQEWSDILNQVVEYD